MTNVWMWQSWSLSLNTVEPSIKDIPNKGHIETPQNKGHIETPQNKGHIETPQNKGHIETPQNKGHTSRSTFLLCPCIFNL